ncbi:CHAP domain-containing protein (plasmid) [Streptomyces clavuligerus]|uniref:FG-GAP repeat domain protein n=2 Tax=Streptomyces clavuligerus TaxID=1901 RepID=D5SMA6_STRCL|nr:FG-GAP repeat domain protein [Streptomyces clavuligerus]QCS10846.1 CHAP domain-containing protein [Streptomyces clavuligerus]
MPIYRRHDVSKISVRRTLQGMLATALLAPALMLSGAQPASASVGSTIIGIAEQNLGNGPCDTNSAGGSGYYGSCGQAWCADFAKWVWAQAGVDVGGLTAAAGSFGQYNGGLKSTPHVGDAVVFNYNGAGYADHVALVKSINSDGTITTVGGNQSGAVTYGTITAAGYYNTQRVSGYVSPIGGVDQEPPMAVGVSPIIGVGDINKTGVADYLARGSDGRLYSYMGKGDGTFTGRTDLGGGWNQYDMVIGVGDINKTGVPDLLARGTDGRLYSYMGKGDGTFTGRTDLGGGWNKYNLIVGAGDINGTGVGDIVARDASGDLWAHMGVGDGTFTGPTKIGHGWNQYDTIIGAGDINKTGVPDLLARGTDGRLYSYMGKGDGTFTGRTDLGGGWNKYNAITGPGDINSTGVADLIARDANGDLHSHMGVGDGTFTGPTKIGHGYNIYN